MDARDKVWSMMQNIATCMLVTMAGDVPHARPMAPIIRVKDRAIWFLTDAGSHKADEMEHAPDVCLTFSDGNARHVSLIGHATLVNDREAIRSIWTPAAKAFWPQGPDDPSVKAILVEPVSAEYWDGDNAVTAVVKTVFATAAGKRAELGANEKVAL